MTSADLEHALETRLTWRLSVAAAAIIGIIMTTATYTTAIGTEPREFAARMWG